MKKIIIPSLFLLFLFSYHSSLAASYPTTCPQLAQTILNSFGGCSAIDCATYSNICDKCCEQQATQALTCTSFTYSNWSSCLSNNQQTRTVVDSLPSGCTGGSPKTTQTCIYAPRRTCTAFTYSEWGTCQSNNTQIRSVIDSNPFDCTGGNPIIKQSCHYVPSAATCTASVSCEPQECKYGGSLRKCTVVKNDCYTSSYTVGSCYPMQSAPIISPESSASTSVPSVQENLPTSETNLNTINNPEEKTISIPKSNVGFIGFVKDIFAGFFSFLGFGK